MSAMLDPMLAAVLAAALVSTGCSPLSLCSPPQEVLGGYIYLVLMGITLVTLCVTWFHMPETRGRYFDAIAEEFHGAEGIIMQN